MTTMAVKIETPRVPKTLRLRLPYMKRGSVVGIEHFDEAQLREVGEQWTEALIAQAKELGNGDDG